MNIDSTDRALLSALRDNSRTSFVDLAKETGVSEFVNWEHPTKINKVKMAVDTQIVRPAFLLA